MALNWRRPSFKSNPSGNCPELAELPNGGVAIRSSFNPDKVVTFTEGEARALRQAYQAGEFDDLA